MCALLVAGLVAMSSSCHTRGINSDVLLDAFNNGATDSTPDPALSAAETAQERVTQTAKASLIRGFATQGIRRGSSIAAWLEDRDVQLIAWKHVQKRLSTCENPPPHPPPPPPPAPAPQASGAKSTPPASSVPAASASADPAAGAASSTLSLQAAPSVVKSPAEVSRDPCASDLRTKLYDLVSKRIAAERVSPATPDVCKDGGVTPDGRLLADLARLDAAIDITAIDIARMLGQERVINETQALNGLEAAMNEAAAYLRDRRWTPSDRAPTFGLSIKGGASTGVYSAGVVWRVLTLLQRYREWKTHRADSHPSSGIEADEARLAVTSGTSAGAIIAAVTDIFHEESCRIDCDLDPSPDKCKRKECATATSCSGSVEERKSQVTPSGKLVIEPGPVCREYARRLTSSLFTCPSQAQLYCIDSRPIWNLAGKQQGLMDFDGLRKYISTYVGPDALVDPTELVLTTVDFRWGQLYVQSDQDPSTVESTYLHVSDLATSELQRNIQASFVLPFIAWPVSSLRIRNKERSGVFLDGGIQSEIPINALVQRGVERAIVVGSAPPQSTPTAAQTNAFSIASRYLDVSLSGVTTSEWRDAVPRARYVEAFEYTACKGLFESSAVASYAGLPSDVEAFCSGRIDEGCGGAPYAPTLAPSGMPDPLAGLAPKLVQTIKNHETGRKFDLVGIFRNESVAPTFGYSFDPVQMKRLFGTGVSDARSRCIELAFFLGMGDAVGELDAWCNETPKFERLLCPPSTQEQKTCDDNPEELHSKH